MAHVVGSGIHDGVLVRLATEQDAGAVAVVQVRTWQAAYRGLIPQEYLDGRDPQERRPAWVQWLRGNPAPAALLVLEHDTDGVVGFIAVAPGRDPDIDPRRVGEVQACYLLPEHWGQGGGRLMMAAALDRLREAGFHEAVLWVLDTNAGARRFYEAGGWRPDGRTKTDASRGFPATEVRYRRTPT